MCYMQNRTVAGAVATNKDISSIQSFNVNPNFLYLDNYRSTTAQ